MTAIIWFALTLPGLLIWTAIWLLPWQPWRTRPRLETTGAQPESHDTLGDITVLIPARDEADLIETTVLAARAQAPATRIVVIDDNSSDATAAMARAAGAEVMSAPPMPAGWSGKLWALEQGLATVDTPLTLLLDADIELSAGSMAQLQRHLQDNHLTLASLFVTLRMTSLWEKLLVPAFGYFFRLLYPFRLSNRPDRRTAAAAGGCILVQTSALQSIGGFAALHDALIDDCELAARIKRNGGRTWLGLTRSAYSKRPYPTLASLWDLVARCAYTQLHYSPARLTGCTLLLLLAFIAPVAALFATTPGITLIGIITLAAMMGNYLPTLSYYQRSAAWALLLPIIGALYLCMTGTSALRYQRGTRSRWKGRHYGT